MAGVKDRVLWGIGSLRTLRTHWALAELGLEYHSEPTEARTTAMDDADFRVVSPHGKVPVLQDGDFVISESAAIVTYLAECYSPTSAPLVPRDTFERARYFEWMSFILMELDATSIYVLRRHEGLQEIYGDAPNANKAARSYFARMIEAATGRLTDDGPYLLGQRFSGIDILMMSCLGARERYDLFIPEPFIRYMEEITQRPAYIAAMAANRSRR